MSDLSHMQERDALRITLAEQMAAFEAEFGMVETTPIRIGDGPAPAFRIHCPHKPKAEPKPAKVRKVCVRMDAKAKKISAIRELAAMGLRIADIADRADFTPKLTPRYVQLVIYEHGIPRSRS